MSGFAKGGSVACFAYVCLMMLLPMFQLDCGMMTFDWTGVDLVRGSAAPLDAMGEGLERTLGGEFERAGELVGEAADDAGELVGGAGEALPEDWGVLVLPGLALLAIVSVLGGRRLSAMVLTATLVAAFAWFTLRGFALERLFDEQLAAHAAAGGEALGDLAPFGAMGDLSIATRKAAPFWLGFGSSGLALVLLAGGRGRGGAKR